MPSAGGTATTTVRAGAAPVAAAAPPEARAPVERARARLRQAPAARPAVVRAASVAVERAVDAGRSPWLPVGVVTAFVLYLVGQRRLDRSAKLSYAGRAGDPDDELIDL